MYKYQRVEDVDKKQPINAWIEENKLQYDRFCQDRYADSSTKSTLKDEITGMWHMTHMTWCYHGTANVCWIIQSNQNPKSFRSEMVTSFENAIKTRLNDSRDDSNDFR